MTFGAHSKASQTQKAFAHSGKSIDNIAIINKQYQTQSHVATQITQSSVICIQESLGLIYLKQIGCSF